MRSWACRLSVSFRWPAATIRALSRLKGATRESTKEIMSLLASSTAEAIGYSGETSGASVRLLEPNERLGKKLNITGKGRCN